jgi:hypothetical protein
MNRDAPSEGWLSKLTPLPPMEFSKEIPPELDNIPKIENVIFSDHRANAWCTLRGMRFEITINERGVHTYRVHFLTEEDKVAIHYYASVAYIERIVDMHTRSIKHEIEQCERMKECRGDPGSRQSATRRLDPTLGLSK